MKTRKNSLLFPVLLLISLTRGMAQIPDFIKEEILRRTEMGINPSIVLGLHDEKGDHYLTSGYTDPQHHQKASGNTYYRLGSLGNTFTGLITGKWIREGKVKNSSGIGSLVTPPLPLKDRQGREITILDVVSYQSGITDSAGVAISPNAEWDSLYADRNLDRIRPYKAGSGFLYSDWAMALLAEGLAERSGISYAELIKRELFTPLGLEFKLLKPHSSASFLAPPSGIPGNDKGSRQITAPSLLWAGNIETLLSYGKLLLSPPNPWKGSIEEATRTFLETENGIQCAMGWFKDEQDNLYHAGHFEGYNTFIAVDRKNQRVITLMTNTGNADITDLGLYLLDPKKNPVFPFIEKPIQPEELKEYPGRYLNDAMGLELDLQVNQGRLQSISQQDTLSLHYMGEHRFFYPGQKAHLSFEKDENGQVVGVLLDKNGKKMMFIKVQ